MKKYTFANYPYIRDMTIKISYDNNFSSAIEMRSTNIETSNLSETMLQMLLDDMEKRRTTQEYFENLQALPCVEHTLFLMDIGKNIGKEIGNVIDNNNLIPVEGG